MRRLLRTARLALVTSLAGLPVLPPHASGTVRSLDDRRQSAETMSSAEIRAAIEFARRGGKPELIEIKTRLLPLGSRRTIRLLTPFWRVATMVRIAAEGDQPLAETDIPALFTQKLVWIVGLPSENYINDYGDMDSPQYLGFVKKIAIRPKGSTGEKPDIQPEWTMSLETAIEARELKRLFGRQLGKANALSAFPIHAFAPGNTILLTYGSTGVSGEAGGLKLKPEVRRLVLTEKHLRDWR